MTQRTERSAPADIRDVEFDGTQLAEIPAGSIGSGATGWHAMERDSDEHIPFLQHVVGRLQATLAELKR